MARFDRNEAVPRNSGCSPRSIRGLSGAACGLLLCSPAWGGGSISLQEVLRMADAANTPSLRSAVAPELSKAAVSEQDVACTATRVGKHIELLGGEVIPPYECPIGKRVLEVRATVRILDERGEEIGAGDRNFAARAAKIERDKFEWMWRDPLR